MKVVTDKKWMVGTIVKNLNRLVFFSYMWQTMINVRWWYYIMNDDILWRIKEEKDMLNEITNGKRNWIGHCMRRCLVVGE